MHAGIYILRKVIIYQIQGRIICREWTEPDLPDRGRAQAEEEAAPVEAGAGAAATGPVRDRAEIVCAPVVVQKHPTKSVSRVMK